MAERIVQEESLTTVADAIRAKGGTTDALSFPTGFAAAIAAIQAEGGGDVVLNGLKVLSGTFTLDTDQTSGYYTIEAGTVSKRPSVFVSFVYMKSNKPSTKDEFCYLVAAAGVGDYRSGSTQSTGVYVYYDGTISCSTTGNAYIAKYDSGKLQIELYTNKANIKAGIEYGWIFLYSE